MRRVVRIILAGPLVVATSALIMLAMPVWYPPGPGMIDHIVVPLLVLPLIWSALFFHACLDQRLWRVALVVVGLGAGSAAMVALRLLGVAFQA